MTVKYNSEIPVSDISKNYDDSCITVVSANVRCYNDGDKNERHWLYRGPLMAQTLIDTKADVIGLQEARKIQYDCICTALQGYGSFIDYRDDGDDPEGCPVFYNLSKFDIERKGTFWLSETPDRISKDWGSSCYRICSYAVLVQKKDGRKLAVFNTHLDHISVEARIKGIRLVLSKLNEFGGMPCVLMGDLNDYENSEMYSSATELFDDAKYKTQDSDSGATYQNWGNNLDDENIDFFLISKEGIDVEQYRVIRTTYDGVYPSDHFPIQLKINLK